MSYRFFLFAIVMLLVPSLAFGSTSGKLKGTVTDQETGGALVGANVIISGTSMGAATDENGKFVILNVPIGIYDVDIKYIGYQNYLMTDVKITADLTTDIFAELSSTALQVGAVTVVAQRPLVNMNATNAVRIVDSEELLSMPVRGVRAVVSLQAGVVQLDNKIYIRGGRDDEVGYYVEGASSRDIVTGNNAVNVIPEAIEELQLQAGGFNAQFGGANSGILTQTLKTGGSSWKFTVQGETDKLAGENITVDDDKQFLDTYSYGYSDLVATVSGALTDKIRLFAAGEREIQRDTEKVFWTGFKFEDLVDTGNRGGTEGEVVPLLDLANGNVPFSNSKRWTANGTLLFDLNPIRLRFSANATKRTFQRRRNDSGNLPILNILNPDRIPEAESSNGLYSLRLTHLLTPTSYYDVSVNLFDRRTKTVDPVFGDNYLLYTDSLAAADQGWTNSTYTQSAQPYDLNGFPFNRPGGNLTNPSKFKESYISFDANYSAQMGDHEVKIGGGYQKYEIRSWGIAGIRGTRSGGGGANLEFLRAFPELTRSTEGEDFTDLQLQMRRNGNIGNYGYDVFGNETDIEGLNGPRNPAFTHLYIQDKFEAGELVINAGVRLDVFDNDDFEWENGDEDPGFIISTFDIDETQLIAVDAITKLSPRLGLAFPVTDKTVFHLQYGTFYQVPELGRLFAGPGTIAFIVGSGNFVDNPAAFNLEPIQTTQYEIGFNQQITESAAFDITAFYRDIRGQLTIEKITVVSSSGASSYNQFVNGDFATTKGVEFTLRMRRTNRLSSSLNYTFSDARGTGSQPGGAVSAIESDVPVPTVISPLEFNRRHVGALNVDYRFDANESGLLKNLGTNLLFTFASGHAFTRSFGTIGQRGSEEGGIFADDDPRPRRPLESVNASTTPWTKQFDFKIDKTLNIGGLNTNLYVYVQNLLNTQNVLDVYDRTGNAFDDGFLSNPTLSAGAIAEAGDTYIDLYNAINIANRQHFWITQGNGTSVDQADDLFGEPRQIRVGARVEF